MLREPRHERKIFSDIKSPPVVLPVLSSVEGSSVEGLRESFFSCLLVIQLHQLDQSQVPHLFEEVSFDFIRTVHLQTNLRR